MHFMTHPYRFLKKIGNKLIICLYLSKKKKTYNMLVSGLDVVLYKGLTYYDYFFGINFLNDYILSTFIGLFFSFFVLFFCIFFNACAFIYFNQ